MKTYTTPAIVSHEIVRSTLGTKSVAFQEVGTLHKPSGAGNLGFGL
jgi:hypothetical protein